MIESPHMKTLMGPDVIDFASIYDGAIVRFGSATVTVAVAVFDGSAVEVAVMVAVPPLTEVTDPDALTVAM
jgi:hypothetical protein